MGPNHRVRAIMRKSFSHYSTTFACLCLLAVGGGVFAAESTAAGLAFFEKKIRPVLVEHCYKCHSASSEKVKGGLLLDTREGIRKGGESGHAVVPKNLDDLHTSARRTASKEGYQDTFRTKCSFREKSAWGKFLLRFGREILLPRCGA